MILVGSSTLINTGWGGLMVRSDWLHRAPFFTIFVVFSNFICHLLCTLLYSACCRSVLPSIFVKPFFSLHHGSASGDYPWSCISQCALLFQVPAKRTKKFRSVWRSLSYVPQLSRFQCFIQTFNLFQSPLTLRGIRTWSFLYAARTVGSKYWIHSSLWNMSHVWRLWRLLALQHKSSTISKKFFF